MNVVPMDQEEYSQFVFNYLRGQHPEFLSTVTFKDDGSFDCRIPSPKSTLFLWLATYDTEITMGFEYSDGKSPWHTHMSLFGAYKAEDEVHAMTSLLRSIFAGIDLIVFSDNGDVWITSNPQQELTDVENGKSLNFIRWIDLYSTAHNNCVCHMSADGSDSREDY